MYTDRLLIIFILGTYLLSPSLGLIALSYWIARSRDVDGV